MNETEGCSGDVLGGSGIVDKIAVEVVQVVFTTAERLRVLKKLIMKNNSGGS